MGLQKLRAEGSMAAPGFMRPEGVVVFHGHSGTLFKVTLEKDEVPKQVSPSLTAPSAARSTLTTRACPPLLLLP